MRKVISQASILAVSFSTLTSLNLAIASETNVLEEVVVTAKTGSRILHQDQTSAPLSEYELSDLRDAGLNDFRDLVDLLSINAGAENNSDNLTQNYTVGTANVNLRGLGVASTLVLLNGRRQVLSSVQTDGGSSFVDVAGLVPMSAVEHVEILKDGASAIYGSDAVAGVVNFITRQDFDGLEIQSGYRQRTNNGSQRDVTVDAVFGARFGEEGGFLIASSLLTRTSLLLGEVDWLRPATSGFGNPASFHLPSLDRTVADPSCERYEGLLQRLSNGSEICRFDYGPQITAIPNEQRLQLWGTLEHVLGDGMAIWTEFGYAYNDINREVSPSFPVLSTPVIPAHHPANPFGEDVLFQGRPYGYGHLPEINYYEHETRRIAAGMQGLLTDSTSWDVSFVHGANDASLNPRDVNAANFQDALLGFGSDACRNQPQRVAGEGDCLFFNPFSSNFAASPSDPYYNESDLYSFIIGDQLGEGESRLTTLEANVSGSPSDLQFSYAMGLQYRKQSLDFAYDEVTKQDGWAFHIGNPDFSSSSDVYAAYGELLVPIGDSIEITGALRFERYGEGVGDTLNPKIGFLLQPTQRIILRASFSTSFRAPSPFQTQGVQTNFTNIVDYDGSRTFAGRRTVGEASLQPETSRTYNFGVTFREGDEWAVNADYWRYAFEDVLRKENAQAIVTNNPFDPRVERTPAGTISIVNVAFINADSIETQGVDVSARVKIPVASGELGTWVELTRIIGYDVTNAGNSIDALGKLNRANLGAPNQKFKTTIGMLWSRSSVAANALLRHIGAYADDLGGSIDSFTSADANVSWTLQTGPAQSEVTITVGAANLFDADPPYVAVAGSYDPRSGDPRGRRIYIKLGFNL